MKNKIYASAPLPFQGQKRFFLKAYKEALTEFVSSGKINTVVDLFGGSGLLSHVAKRIYPQLRIIYNDYDDYHVRLNNIDTTNRIINTIREMVKEYPHSRRLPEEVKTKILAFIVSEARKAQHIDYITLSSQLFFPGSGYATSYERLCAGAFYNHITSKNYGAQDYLDGIEITRQDYRHLFKSFKDNPERVLFVVDPPYLSTDVSSYNKVSYWQLSDYLAILNVLEADNYIYFTSGRSQLVELLEYLSRNYSFNSPFANAQKKRAIFSS